MQAAAFQTADIAALSTTQLQALSTTAVVALDTSAVAALTTTQVQALTAEGRLSGVILLALPFGLFLIMLYIKPDYIEKLWTHPLGIKMSVGALILQLLGAVVIKKIVNIKV